MTSRTYADTVNITAYTPYRDDDVADDTLFNIYVDTRLVLLGDDLFTDDAIAMDGQLRNRGELTIDDGLALTDNSVFVNADTVTQNGGELQLGQADDDASVARNVAGATYTLSEGAGIEGAGASRFVNLGTVQQSGNSTISADYYDHGALDVSGTLTFDTTVARFLGAIEGAGSVVADDAVFAGATIDVDDFAASSARFLSDVTATGATLAMSTIVLVNSHLTLLGDDTISGLQIVRGDGTIDVSGSTTISAPTATEGLYNDYTISIGAGVSLDNSGKLTLVGADNNVSMLATPIALLDLSGSSTINNLAGATWIDAAYDAGFSGADATFQNAGTFTENANVDFNLAFVNNGLVDMGPGERYADTLSSYYPALHFDDAVTGAGTIALGDGLVEIGASIAASQTVEFEATGAINPFYATLQPFGASTPTLQIDDPTDFAATITNFDQSGVTNDTIIVNAAGWSFEAFSPNASGTGGALEFTNGASQASISLTGDYDPTKFSAAVSGNSTTITYG